MTAAKPKIYYSRHSFASCCLWGEAGKFGISGIWVFKGQQLAFEHSEDWQVYCLRCVISQVVYCDQCEWTSFINQVDYASYDWVKLDPTLPATRAIVNQYLRSSDLHVFGTSGSLHSL